MNQSFPVANVRPNPWNTRTQADPAAIAELAEDLKAHGLLQVPQARPHPTIAGAVELAFGHRRFEAWKIAFPDRPFPVDVEPLTDRAMSDLAASENGQRADLSAIEKATAIQRRMKEFQLNQLEAGRPFGLTTQGAVSNLLRLLKLPAEVQDLTRSGQLAERNARTLLTVEKIDPKATLKIAKESISAENPEDYIGYEIEQLLEKKGRSFHKASWDTDWPATPIVLEAPRNGLTELPPCKGCAFFFMRNDDAYCGRADCFDAKHVLAMPERTAEAAKELGIAVAAPGEKVTVLFDGSERYDYARIGAIAKIVKAKRPELRLVPWPKWDHNNYERNNRLGSEFVALATVDPAASEKFMQADADEKKKQVPAAGADESEAERRKRIEHEEKAAAERRAERAEFHRQKYDTLWLLENASRLTAQRLVIEGTVLLFIEGLVTRHYHIPTDVSQLAEFENDLEKQIKGASGTVADLLRKQHIVFNVLADKVIGYGKPEDKLRFGKARQAVERIVFGDKITKENWYSGAGWNRNIERFGVSLPARWDEPPVHKTFFNCWKCGKFGSHEGSITKREILEDGWVVVDDDPAKGVFCSADHANQYDPRSASRKAAAKATEPKPTAASSERVDQEIKAWLVGTPAGDINFETSLKEANAKTLRAALKDDGLTKTARAKIDARLRKLEKSAQGTKQ